MTALILPFPNIALASTAARSERELLSAGSAPARKSQELDPIWEANR